MRLFTLVFFCAGALLLAQKEGNYTIRFEPKAILQTDVPVPFEIDVTNDLRKPLIDAKVTLQIETTDQRLLKVFQASAVSPGVYIAKPVFPESGEWSVYVEVRRNDQLSARTLKFTVSK